MLRKFGFSVAIVSALLAAKVHALGMGEIRVKSALNEPLHAEIALFQIKNLSPLQIKSRMADLNDFALSGLATQRALTNVRFQVRVRANGTGRIILTSKSPITEPFMNFLVEVNWPSGRLIREYTLLLDPPSYKSSLNGRPFVASESAAVTTPVVTPKPIKKTKTVNAKRVASGVVVGPNQYYITPQDTLWDIAIANRPNKSITPHQMMVLMQQKNPQAFPNGNINVMRARQVIDLPTMADIEGLSRKDAQREVSRQTRLWKSGDLPKVSKITEQAATKKALAKVAAEKIKKDLADKVKAKDEAAKKAQSMAAADASKMTDKEVNKDAAQGESLKPEKGMINVVTPEEAEAKRELQVKAEAMALAASKDSEKIAELLKDNAELDVKLALSQESIDKLERDNTELNKKLDTIVKQLEDINRLILLKDEQLAAMQDERQESEKDQSDKVQQESEKGWFEKLLENTIGLIAAGVGWLLAVIAGVLLLLRRTKKDPEEQLVQVDERSEPSISMPEEMIEEELEELEALEESEELEVDVNDLDLDLDLDMDMDLDESFDPEALEAADDGNVDDNDLAAELEAQLNASEEDDDDLDMLEGIDSLEFDLGETDEEFDLDEEPELDEEQQALADFAKAMEEDTGAEPELESEEDDAQALLDNDDDLSEQDELEIELPEVDASSVEEDEMDIGELVDPVASLEEMEQAQALEEEADIDGAEESVESLIENDLVVGEDLEIELDEAAEELSLDSAAINVEEEEQIPMDDALGDLLGLGVEPEPELELEPEPESEPESEDRAESEDDAELQIDEEVDQDAVQAAEVDDTVLDEELDELLSSTDDDIALDAVAPEFDADNEEGIDLLSGEDGVRMKLDLARAYVEMGDDQGAQDIIDEVMAAGDDEQKKEAQELLESLKSN